MISEGWALICMAGFYGWILSTLGFILKAFPVKGTFRGRPAALWGGAIIIFYTMWLTGMYNA